MKFFKWILFLLFTFNIANSFGQSISDLQALKEKYLGTQSDDNWNKAAPGGVPLFKLNGKIDKNRYIVDVGDVFWAKIDIAGPDYLSVLIPVANNGYAVFQQVKSVHVAGKTLSESIQSIKKTLNRNYKDAIVEVYFYKPRSIQVQVIYQGNTLKTLFVPATTRLLDVYQPGIVTDTTLNELGIYKYSLREARISRKGKTYLYDLYDAIYNGDEAANPYLEHGDNVFIQYLIPGNRTVTIDGFVAVPGEYEIKDGDCLKRLIRYAGGFLEGADTSHIEIYRYKDDKINFEKLDINLKGKNCILRSGDRIYVRNKPQFRQNFTVEIVGEVEHPGVYPIIDGVTTIRKLIEMSGGTTNRSFLRDAMIIRNKYLPNDTELERLRKMSVDEMNKIERNYFKIRSRENIRIVNCDFEEMWYHNKKEENVVLRDGDKIIIPENKGVIFVSGGVFNPGMVTFREGWTYLKYIDAAGGFNERARKGDIKIIKAKTGIWMDASKNIVLEEGDIIFTPEKEEIDWWKRFREGLTIVTQIGTLAVIMINLRKL